MGVGCILCRDRRRCIRLYRGLDKGHQRQSRISLVLGVDARAVCRSIDFYASGHYLLLRTDISGLIALLPPNDG